MKAVVAGAVAFFNAPSGLYSSPTDIRIEDHRQKWEPVMDPPPWTPPARPFRQPNVKIGLAATEMTVESDAASPGAGDGKIVLIDLGDGAEAVFPGGPKSGVPLPLKRRRQGNSCRSSERFATAQSAAATPG